MATTVKRKQPGGAFSGSSFHQDHNSISNNSFSFPSRVLWQFIGGIGVLQPQDIVEEELTKSQDRLVLGLNYYASQSTPSGERIRNERNISDDQITLIQNLSKYLGIEEVQCHDIYCSFLTYEYRSSKKTLETTISNPRQTPILMAAVKNFYFTERLYLLRCMRHILTYWTESGGHQYWISYDKFIREVMKDDRLINSLTSQYFQVCTDSSALRHAQRSSMDNKEAFQWAKHNLREQCEMLELLLLYYKAFQVQGKTFLELVENFKRQGFGRHHSSRHIVGTNCDELLTRIGYLQLLVILQCLDFETLSSHNNGSCDDHHLLKDDNFKDLERVFPKTSTSCSIESVLMLAWATIRFIHCKQDADVVTFKLGSQALQNNCFSVLADLLQSEQFSGTSVLAMDCHYLVYVFLYTVLTMFHEDTLGDSKALYSCIQLVLSREFVATHFWQSGLDDGLGVILQGSINKFPLEFSTFIKLCAALSLASVESANKVIRLLNSMPVYMELFDNNSSQMINSTNDSSVWTLTQDKYPFSHSNFVIKRGCQGHLLPQEKGGAIIQWQGEYDGWALIRAEIDQLFFLAARGSAAVPITRIERVTEICQLLTNTLTSEPACYAQFVDFMPLLYQIIARFGTVNKAPLQLLALCIQSLNQVAKFDPNEVWENLRETGLLPFMSENLDNLAEIVSGAGLHVGNYGSILIGQECPSALYPVTTSLLSLIITLVEPLSKSGHTLGFMACILYVIREVFPAYNKWRYINLDDRYAIGECCLKLFHKAIDINVPISGGHRFNLRQVCVQSLLYSDSGLTLLDIVATGVDNVELVQSQQASFDEGPGVKLINIIRLSFSVLNRILLLKPGKLPKSAVELALSSQRLSAGGDHILATIAQYIYHRYDSALPNIAIVLLKRLAVIQPMVIMACLGRDAECLRDAFLRRLQASTEDINLKVVILEFLSVCVGTQPGLIEMFLNLKSKNITSAKTIQWKDVVWGKDSCLSTVLELLDPQKQGTYLCTDALTRACTGFIKELWLCVHEPVMTTFRHHERFWSSVIGPIITQRNEQYHHIQMQTDYILTAANVFTILSQEFFIENGNIDVNLKNILETVTSNRSLENWSRTIMNCLAFNLSSSTYEDSHPMYQLLNAWKSFLITVTVFSIPELAISNTLKERFLDDICDGCDNQIQLEPQPMSLRVSALCSTLYFTLLKSWCSSVSNIDSSIKKIIKILTKSSASTTPIFSVHIGLIGSLTSLLTASSASDLSGERKQSLLRLLCPMTEQCILQLGHSSSSKSRCKLTSLNTKSSSLNRDQRGYNEEDRDGDDTEVKLKMLVMCLCTIRRLCEICDSPSDWLITIQKHSILSLLMVSVNEWMKVTKGLHYVHSTCMFLLTLAKSTKGCESIVSTGLLQQICLTLSCLYNSHHVQHSTTNTPHYLGGKRKWNQNTITWHSIYCDWLRLYAVIINTMKFAFLKDTLDFVGVHQERIQQVMELSGVTFTEAALMETENSCHLLRELAHFVKEWKFQLPHVYDKLMVALLKMFQMFVSLLIRPRYLLHIIEKQAGGDQCIQDRSHSAAVVSTIHNQTAADDIVISSTQCANIQNQMLKIISVCLGTLRLLTPNLPALVFDHCLDLSEYETFLQIGFGRPSIGQDELEPVTFGTILDCITVCLRYLFKINGRLSSPNRSPKDTGVNLPSKSVIQYILENCLYLTISQACRHLCDDGVHPRDKQLLKRELSAELNSFFMSYHRYLKRGAPPSPALAFSPSIDQPFFALVHEYLQKVSMMHVYKQYNYLTNTTSIRRHLA